MRKQPKSRVPWRSLLETGLPIERLYELAKREGNSKKPIYEIHKWWARRLGHVFRLLLIAATTSAYKRQTKKQSAALLKKFYRRNDLKGLVTLDPFMGGGTSVVEALKCGARVIGVDIDPVAWFVTKKEIEDFQEAPFRKCFKGLEQKVADKIHSLYETRDSETGTPAEIVNAFWVSRYTCPQCNAVIDAHPHFRLSFNSASEEQTVFCKLCNAVRELPLLQKWFKCNSCQETTVILKGAAHKGILTCSCGVKTAVRDLIEHGTPPSKHLFAIEYSVIGDKNRPKRKFKKADQLDLDKFKQAEAEFLAKKGDLLYPTAEIPKNNRFDNRPISHGYSHYDQLFNPRQLLCLSMILREILSTENAANREYLLIAFSDCLASNNLLASYAFGYQKVTPLFAIHGYQVPQRPVEGNVWGNRHFGRGTFIRCVTKLIEGKRYALKPFEYRYTNDGRVERVFTKERIATVVAPSPDSQSQLRRACLLNQSSAQLSTLKSASIDLILTDPPFYNNLPYSELSDFYYQWLRLYFEKSGQPKPIPSSTPMNETLLVRRRTKAEHEKYVDGLLAAMRECARVLKPDGLMVFTFHHRDLSAWHALASVIMSAKFAVTAVSPVRAEGVSGFHSYEGTPKWDSVICCRPREFLSRKQRLSERGDAPIGSIDAIQREVKKWGKRMKAGKMTWNNADQASLAYSFALREIVNNSSTPEQSAALLEQTSAKFPQDGTPKMLPKWISSIRCG